MYRHMILVLYFGGLGAVFSQSSKNKSSRGGNELDDEYQGIDWVSVSVSEGEQLNLSCPKGKYIRIISAEYGQLQGYSKCSVETTHYIVDQRCGGKRRCTLSASNTEFGDPCPGTIKRLLLKYQCEQGNDYKNAEIPEGRSSSISCPEGSSIRVYDALYGRAGSSPDNRLLQAMCGNSKSLDVVSGRCQYSSNCHISSSNAVFGDPCPGVEKILYIDYVCQKDTVKRALACEYPTSTISNEVKLECHPGYGIDVVSARYGRSHPYVCPRKGATPFNPAGCLAANSASYVYTACQRKSSCTLFAVNNVFGDPCVGNEKYLEVEYQCKENAN